MSNPTASGPFPRLAISDLLVLTLTAAFGMAWGEALQSDPSGTQLHRVAHSLLAGSLLGVSFFGFAVLVRELVRGRPLSSLSPGHWWFLIAAPQLLIGMTHYVISIGASSWFAERMVQWRTIDASADALFYAVFSLAWLWATTRVQSRQWKVVFALKTAEQLVWVAFQIHRAIRTAGLLGSAYIHPMHFFGVMGTIWVAIALSLPVAVALDRRQKIRRDWLHYVAIGVIACELIDSFQGFGRLSIRWWQAIVARLLP